MSDPRGDPLARRAAELLRRDEGGADERAIERIIAALRESANGGRDTPTELASDPDSHPTVVPAAGSQPKRRFSLTGWPALAAAVLIFALGLGAGALLLSPRDTRSVETAANSAREVAPVSQASDASNAEPRLVEFVLVAPRAARVSLVGEFNGWDASATPMRHTERGDGTWSVSVPLGAGRHVYAFVIDNSTWIPDPQAPLAPEQWYGERNSVVVVSGGPRS